MIQTPQSEKPHAGLHSEAIPSVRQSRFLDKSKTPWFYGLLVGCKILATLSTFLLYDFFQVNHELLRFNHRSPPTGVIFGSWSTHIQILSVIQILSGVTFVLCQRRFSPWNKSLTTLSRRDWFRIFKHATLLSVFLLLWMAGLRLAGPFQTVIITAHYNFTLAGIFTGFCIAKSGVKLRGGVLFAAGIFVLLVFNKTSPIQEDAVPSKVDPTSSMLELKSERSLSANSVSILILVACLAYKIIFEALSKNLAADFGGSRGLHALSTCASGFILLVLYLIDLMSGADMIPFWSNLTTMVIITFFGFVLEYYVDNVCLKRLKNPAKVVRIGTTATMGSALLYAVLRTSDEIPNMATILAFVLIFFGTLSLTAQEKARGGGSFVGYSSDGLPLFNFSSNFSTDAYIPSWKNLLLSISSILKQIHGDVVSRKMFYISLLTALNFLVEIVYVIFVDSIGVQLDFFQIFFDTLTLFIGLSASVICRWKPSKTYPFGYGRVEILSCFLNSLILVVISLRLLVYSCQQMYDPVISGDQTLIAFTIARLCVKLFGVYMFKTNIGGGHAHFNNMNVKGVFRHLIADIMETTGRIVSSLIVTYTGILKLDALIFLVVGIMIVISIIPLLTDSSKTLLLSIPNGLEKNLQEAVLQILTMEGVKGYRNARFWTHAPNLLAGSIHIQATQDINEQYVIRQVNNLFNSMGFTHFTTQLEKDEFIARKSLADSNEASLNKSETINIDLSEVKTFTSGPNPEERKRDEKR